MMTWGEILQLLLELDRTQLDAIATVFDRDNNEYLRISAFVHHAGDDKDVREGYFIEIGE